MEDFSFRVVAQRELKDMSVQHFPSGFVHLLADSSFGTGEETTDVFAVPPDDER
jgi:hypothetical protein